MDGGGSWQAFGTKLGGVGRMSEDAECEMKTLMTSDHTVFQVCSSR